MICAGKIAQAEFRKCGDNVIKSQTWMNVIEATRTTPGKINVRKANGGVTVIAWVMEWPGV
jgi:hypothetical protein